MGLALHKKSKLPRACPVESFTLDAKLHKSKMPRAWPVEFSRWTLHGFCQPAKLDATA